MVKRGDPESLQAEFAAARACGGTEHGDVGGLSPGMRRKLCLELAGKRAALAQMRAWNELLRMYVRDILSHVVDVPKHKMDSCTIRATLQILRTSTRAPQNQQPSAEMRLLVAVVTDAQGVAQITALCAAIKQAATKFSPTLANFVKRMVRVVSLSV